MDHETGRRHNAASEKKLHKHELHGKTTAMDRVLRSRPARHRGNMPAIVLDHHMRVIAGEDWVSLLPPGAWASSHFHKSGPLQSDTTRDTQ